MSNNTYDKLLQENAASLASLKELEENLSRFRESCSRRAEELSFFGSRLPSVLRLTQADVGSKQAAKKTYDTGLMVAAVPLVPDILKEPSRSVDPMPVCATESGSFH
jgi:hypothetical protein